jgi:hypothetical protein
MVYLLDRAVFESGRNFCAAQVFRAVRKSPRAGASGIGLMLPFMQLVASPRMSMPAIGVGFGNTPHAVADTGETLLPTNLHN